MKPIGVYIHFPWCLKKCPYCDFVSFAKDRADIDHEGYANAVLAELSLRREELEGRPLRSVFFGGGTPSLWAPRSLGRVLKAVLEASGGGGGGGGGEGAEITVECNPTSLDEERARALRDQGVNRLSVGVQGLDPARLKFLGRLHDPDGGLSSVEAALRSGMPRVSADLIYGVAIGAEAPSPIESAAEVDRVASTGVTHVSAYSLTIEPGTQFGELARKGRLPIAPDDAVAEAFFAIEARLEARGLAHYEISNYARPGDEAQHNLGYWRGTDYLGLGCAAYGTIGDAAGHAVRYRNVPDPARYVEAARAGDLAALVESEEPLDPETRLRERIMLGLRLRDGFDLEGSARELGIEAWTTDRRKAADRLIARGDLTVENGHLRLPSRARVYADGITAALF